METSVFPVLLIFWTIYVIFSGVFRVRENTVAIIERLGSFKDLRNAGWHYKIPVIDRIAGKVSLSPQQMTMPLEAVANDNMLFKISVLTEFKVSKDRVQKLFYKTPDPTRVIKKHVNEAVSAELRRYNPEEVVHRKNDIADAVQREIEKSLYEPGFIVVKTQVTDIRPV